MNGRLLKRSIYMQLMMLFAAAGAQGLQFNTTFTDRAGETWTSTRRGVINQALGDWGSSILDNQTVDLTLTFTSAGSGNYLGRWYGSAAYFPGDDLYPWSGTSHTIRFNVDRFTGMNYLWWDPTPTTVGDLPFSAWDALSVARHEFGHMLGLTDDFYYDDADTGSARDRWADQMVGLVFDPNGLNVTMADSNNLGHVADSGATAGDLMVPGLPNSIRRPISLTDLDMLALAHDYAVIPEPASLCLLGIAALALLRRRDK